MTGLDRLSDHGRADEAGAPGDQDAPPLLPLQRAQAIVFDVPKDWLNDRISFDRNRNISPSKRIGEGRILGRAEALRITTCRSIRSSSGPDSRFQ